MGFSCCVIHCKNTTYNSKYKFYSFPNKKYEIETTNKWIKAVQNANKNYSWIPKPYTRICAAHFIGNSRSLNSLHPGYVPSLFGSSHSDEMIHVRQVKRHERFMKRRVINSSKSHRITEIEMLSSENKISELTESIEYDYLSGEIRKTIDNDQERKMKHQECQKTTFIIGSGPSTLICNKFVTDGICEVQTQTDIAEHIIIYPKTKGFRDQCCGTLDKKFVDIAVGPNEPTKDAEYEGFRFKAIKTDQQLTEIAGVDFANFNYLLTKTEDTTQCVKINKEKEHGLHVNKNRPK